MKNQPGYIALSSILVISAVILIIGTTISFLSINEAQVSLATENSDQGLNFVDSCTEDTLMRLNQNNALPSTIVLPAQATCTVTTDSHVDNNWTFTVAGTYKGTTKQIQVQATRTTSTLTVTSWKQI